LSVILYTHNNETFNWNAQNLQPMYCMLDIADLDSAVPTACFFTIEVMHSRMQEHLPMYWKWE